MSAVPDAACLNVRIHYYIMTHLNSNPSSLPKRILSQFATYRIALSRVMVLTSLLVISFLATLPEVSRAQTFTCPSSSFPSPGTTWYGPLYMNELISGTMCTVQITFCEGVESDGTIDFYIEAVNPSDADCGPPLTQSQLILGGIAAFESDPNVLSVGGGPIFTIPSCVGGYYQEVSYTVAYCWQMAWPPPPPPDCHCGITPFYIPCTGDVSYCVKSCEWCYDVASSQYEETNCTSSGTFQGECSDPPPDGWVTGTCYDIHPCN